MLGSICVCCFVSCMFSVVSLTLLTVRFVVSLLFCGLCLFLLYLAVCYMFVGFCFVVVVVIVVVLMG